jgi:hypothetical protein
VVRVIARDGIEVSCNASTYAAECELTSWTFSFNGVANVASKSVWARNLASNTDGGGEILLRDDATERVLIVPTVASTAPAIEGRYVGKATSSTVVNGIDVTAVVRGDHVVVRDPSRSLAPDGVLVLDLLETASDVATARKVVWLRPLGQDTGGAVGGEYKASAPVASNAATGSLAVPFTITLPGSTVSWTLQLARAAAYATECATSSECAAGNTCPSQVGVCVPDRVWTPPVVSLENQFEDPRSSAWWTAVSGLIGVGESVSNGSSPAFATVGAELIESLLCSTVESTGTPAENWAGRLGPLQVKQGTAQSLSGDLRCVGGPGAGNDNQAPGAVGLVTYNDRKNDKIASQLLQTCLEDLARAPATSFAGNFNADIGACANLGRFLPALRLLATGENQKASKVADARTHGLFRRLLQQWMSLHGFVASVGLAEREYDDATAASTAEARSELMTLLDTLDGGWAALLDKRVAALIPSAAGVALGTDATNDYRWAKEPVYYWTFNGSQAGRDIVRNVELTQRTSNTNNACKILSSRNSVYQGPGCPGFRATLPSSAPSIATGGNLSVVFSADGYDYEFADMAAGGTIVATETLAVIANPLAYRGLMTMHPTADGGVEHVYFDIFTLGRHTENRENVSFTYALVRDTVARTYTLYTWQIPCCAQTATLTVKVQPYSQAVSGRLPTIAAGTLLVGNSDLFPNPNSFHGYLDDIAIFNSRLSGRELARIGFPRSTTESRRDVYPTPISIDDTKAVDFRLTVGASILETQAAHLDVVVRLLELARYDMDAACTGDDAAAQTAMETILARSARTLRQSAVVEDLVASDQSDRTVKARGLLKVKRAQIARSMKLLSSCADPYGMGEREIPLYFGDVDADAEPRRAFFAASDHLIDLASQRTGLASEQLTRFRTYWDSARQSKIQQQQEANTRSTRIEETTSKFGGFLKQVCGITSRTAEQVMLDVEQNRLNIDTCFVKETTQCQTNGNGPILNADPTCYRGSLGSALMDMRAAYNDYEKAYQEWQSAMENAKGADRMCVLNEMDYFGCSALNRHKIEGVTCPAGHEGIYELIAAYNRKQRQKDDWKAVMNLAKVVVATVVTVVATAVTGPGGAFVAAGMAGLGLLSSEMDRAEANEDLKHKDLLAKRSTLIELRACWTEADRFRGAITAAAAAQRAASDRMQAAHISFQNALDAAREAVVEGPIVLERERNRTALPLAFHYWLPEEMSHYNFLMDAARRYAYVALRATEYDTLETFVSPRPNRPHRAAVVSAWRPNALVEQIGLMRSLTDTRTTPHGVPSKDHLVLEVARDLFGLSGTPSDFATYLAANARPVYSKAGEYLGEGVRFTFLPPDDLATPQWRCAERLWRANAGGAGFSGTRRVKLLKRTVFASRECDSAAFDTHVLRPEQNLLVSAGDLGASYVEPQEHTVADINTVRLDTPDALQQFLDADNFTNGSSQELAGQGLYGDYVLLFPAGSTQQTRVPDLSVFSELFLRFDFISVDDLPSTSFFGKPRARIDQSSEPIVVD